MSILWFSFPGNLSPLKPPPREFLSWAKLYIRPNFVSSTWQEQKSSSNGLCKCWARPKESVLFASGASRAKIDLRTNSRRRVFHDNNSVSLHKYYFVLASSRGVSFDFQVIVSYFCRSLRYFVYLFSHFLVRFS